MCRREAVRAGLEGGRRLPRGLKRRREVSKRPHPTRGLRGFSSRGLRGGFRGSERWRASLWRGGRPGEQRLTGVGETRHGEHGLDGGRKASKSVKLAVGSDLRSSASRESGMSASAGGKDDHSSRGKSATRAAARGVAETGGERRREARSRTPVDNGKGASGLERGTRSSRGKGSEGGDPGTAAACNRAARSDLPGNR
jgi:hypothetical protein